MSVFALLFSQNVYAETRINKDLDGDQKPDSVWLQDDVLHIKLSSQNNQVMRDTHKPFHSEKTHLQDRGDGFAIVFDGFSRWTHTYDYVYDKVSGKIQIVGYQYWKYASDDESVYLKTGRYNGVGRYLAKRKLRHYKIRNVRLSNVRPIVWDDPNRNTKLSMMFDAIRAEKKRRNIVLD